MDIRFRALKQLRITGRKKDERICEERTSNREEIERQTFLCGVRTRDEEFLAVGRKEGRMHAESSILVERTSS